MMRRRIVLSYFCPAVFTVIFAGCGAGCGCKRKVETAAQEAKKILPEKAGDRLEPQSQWDPGTLIEIAPGFIEVAGAKVVELWKGGRVRPSDKKDGQGGYFITPLYRELHKEMKKIRAIMAAGPEKEPEDIWLNVTVNHDIAYRTLAEVLFTAACAEFANYRVSIIKNGRKLLKKGFVEFYAPRHDDASALGVLGIPGQSGEEEEEEDAAGSKKSLHLSVVAGEEGFYVSSRGGVLEDGKIPNISVEGQSEYDYRTLSEKVIKIKNQHEDEDQIRIGAEDDVSCESLAKMMNAVLWDGEKRLFSSVLFVGSIIM